MRPSVLFVFMNAESVLICVAGHVYMYATDARVVYVCLCNMLVGNSCSALLQAGRMELQRHYLCWVAGFSNFQQQQCLVWAKWL